MEKNIRYNNNPLKLNEILFIKNENSICKCTVIGAQKIDVFRNRYTRAALAIIVLGFPSTL